MRARAPRWLTAPKSFVVRASDRICLTWHAGMAQSALQASSRPELAEVVQPRYSDLGPWAAEGQLPVCYSEAYNISFFGLEKLHPFDACKFRRVVNQLVSEKVFTKAQLVPAAPATWEMLADVHDEDYLAQLKSSSWKMAQVVELPPVAAFPNFIVQRVLNRPQLHHVGGTMKAMALALTQGWAINLGGGMHHAHREVLLSVLAATAGAAATPGTRSETAQHPQDGAGWCAYADAMLGIRRLRAASGGQVPRVLYIDTDVHQGNGVERDKLHFADEDLCIVDLYNASLWPGDGHARQAIDIEQRFRSGIEGPAYLELLSGALAQIEAIMPRPDICIYNAGTDILDGDPLGNCCVSAEDVVTRDQRVWQYAADRGVPVCMLLSGGYARHSAQVIAASIANLFRTFKLGVQ